MTEEVSPQVPPTAAGVAAREALALGANCRPMRIAATVNAALKAAGCTPSASDSRTNSPTALARASGSE